MDTAILGVLQKQDFTVKSINAIIDEFKPKNLINIQNLNDAYAEFSPICHAIREVIRQDQIEGGMAGIYNPSITQRLNNLVDKQETSINIPPMFKD